MSDEIHVGTIVTFEITVKDQDDTVIDISTATSKQLIFRKPDKTKLTKDVIFVTDGTDGKIQYTTSTTDLSQAGKWELQGYIVLAFGGPYSSIIGFDVKANL